MYLVESKGRASFRFFLDGMIASIPAASASSTTALESYPLSARSAFADKPFIKPGSSPTSERLPGVSLKRNGLPSASQTA